MLPDIELAVRLQSLDDRLAAIAKEIAELPKHVTAIEKKLDNHLKRLEADRASLVANQKERRKLEGDIQTHEQKISKLKGQMMDAKSNDIYNAFQHEIGFCQQEISRIEDRILELMGEADPLEKAVKAAEGELAVERKQVDAEKKTAQERSTIDRAEAAKLNAIRAEIVTKITPKIYAEYERIRKGRAGVAVSEAINGRCSKCHIQIRQQFLQELKQATSVMICESCKRILYYAPPESFDDLVPASVR